ncbi:hypothetical protein PC114_g17701 [Phytophthora cactorum]|nr:hypothetical protein PC112_g5266 [Phytophthora cactorum]KAG2889945.1 hypothetical protein PC114_g17701 [Phytophthora cactorum]
MGGCPTEVGARQNGALCGLSMNSYKFYSYALNGPRDEDTNEKNFQLEYAEHRELYKRKYGSGTQEENGGSSSSSSPPVEAFDASEAELSVSCGEEVSEQAKQSLAESILHKEADALFDKWIDLRVEWVEVAKKQYVTKEERNEVVGKLYMALPDGKRVWNVECLCQYINLHQWFPDTGKQSFPTIALARACLAVALLIDSLSRKGVLDRIFCYEPASH